MNIATRWWNNKVEGYHQWFSSKVHSVFFLNNNSLDSAICAAVIVIQSNVYTLSNNTSVLNNNEKDSCIRDCPT